MKLTYYVSRLVRQLSNVRLNVPFGSVSYYGFISICIVQPGIHFMSGSVGSHKCYRNINIYIYIFEGHNN
jgi:hypothetical protein